jgi:methoxymalonate biosynthesis protein
MPDKPALVKCLVWDLDNTLWQGTLLEDPDVRIPSEIREVISTLDSRGILQSISSKNDYDHAWERLKQLGVADYFVHPQVGWGRKSDAVLHIAEQLNFATGTIAFIDDQPAERAEVAFRSPEVRCYTADQALALPGLAEFSPEVVTIDARRRRQMYQAGFRRDAERESFPGPDEEFLRSLELVMTIKRADEDDLSRVEELTLRTSQMNATGPVRPARRGRCDAAGLSPGDVAPEAAGDIVPGGLVRGRGGDLELADRSGGPRLRAPGRRFPAD